MRFHYLIAAVVAAAPVAAADAAYTISIEAPGVQNSTAAFTAVGVESFNGLGVGTNQTFSSSFGGSAFTGTYNRVRVMNADQYGGAGGSGRYVVQFGTPGFTLDLASSRPGGVTYFGFWLSALDNGNTVRFFQNNVQLFSFDATVLRTFVNSQPNASAYRCNPNPPANRNCGEPYAFLNFYAHGGTTFDRVVFDQVTGGGYESDNHTVGIWRSAGGTWVPTPGSVPLQNAVPNALAVPEPAAWSVLLAGFGMVGAALRRRRHVVAA
jgi:hypothetical protein